MNVTSTWAHRRGPRGPIGRAVWLCANVGLAFVLSQVGAQHGLPLLLRWSLSPGPVILAALLIILGVSCSGRRKHPRRLYAAVLLLGIAVLLDVLTPVFPAAVPGLAIGCVMIAESISFDILRTDRVTAALLWLMGVYVQAVHFFNWLAPGQAMRFFFGGEAI